MANEILITDLVAQEALDQLEQLDRKMEGTLEQFKDCAMELAKGIKIPVEVSGDLEKLRELSNATMQKASQAAQQYTQQLQQQQQVIANTTNTISRQLMEQEKLNKVQRETYEQQERSLDIADRILGSHEQNVRALAKYNVELKNLKQAYKDGAISAEEYTRRELELKTAKQETQRILTNEAKQMQAAEGSYQRLSLQLERMKMAYKQLNEEEKNGVEGQELEKSIQETDAHLKDLAADMGEFQRNVGNYAVANQSVRSELKELTMQMAQMLADGVDPTSEGFLQVAERAGKLKDAMGDAKAAIKDYANDTQGLTQGISVLKTAVGGWQAVAGAMGAFGMAGEDAAKVTQKLMGIMSLMNGIQRISTELTTNGTGAYRAYHAILKLLGVEKAAVTTATAAETTAIQAEAVAAGEAAAAQSAEATATEAATVASGEHTAAVGVETAALTGATTAATALKVALAALGIGAVIALIVSLYEAVKTFNKEAEEAEKVAHGMNEAVKEGEKSSASAAAELKYYTGVVNDFNGSTEEEKRLVDELNSKYGDALGYYKDLVHWKGALADISEYYIDVLKWEAVAQANLSKYAEATASGNATEAAEYERAFEFYKGQAAKQASLVKRMIKQHGGGSRPTSGGSTKRTSSGRSRNNAEDEAKKAIEDINKLLEDSTDIFDEWYRNGLELAIENIAKVSTTSVETFEENSKLVKTLYLQLQSEIEKQRDKAIAAKNEEFDKAIEAAKKYGKDTEKLESARTDALTVISNEYQNKIEANTAKMNETIASMQKDLLTNMEKETARHISNIQAIKAATLADLRDQYIEELRLAGNNEKKIQDIKKKYVKDSAKIAEQSAIEVAKASIEGLEDMLAMENLTDEERERLSKELADAKIKLAKAVADAEEHELDRTIADEKEAREKRLAAITNWTQKVGDAIGKVSELFSALYENQLNMIESQIEAEQEKHDKEMDHITELAEHGAITAEEAEIRKRDAEAATAAKQEQLEKKKASIEYKKALMEKANTISQIGIATALGIMQALAMWPPNLPLAAFVGAMGAIQVATALAQPIKAYKEGTKGKPHPGGLALVGDGNQKEIVMYNGDAWVTPDKPTLVDLPKGAEVLPDADILTMGSKLPTSVPRDKATGQPIIINDYTSLEGRVANNTRALTRELRAFRGDMARQLKRQKFNAYINSRI